MGGGLQRWEGRGEEGERGTEKRALTMQAAAAGTGAENPFHVTEVLVSLNHNPIQIIIKRHLYTH